MVSRSTLAATTDGDADFAAQRVVTVRLFSGHFHRLALLALIEAGVVVVSFFGAIHLRFAGFSSTLSAFEATVGSLWARAFLISAVFLLSLAALGLYQLRQRAGFRGVLIRLVLAALLAEAALSFIFYVAPSLFIGRGVTLLTGAIAFSALALTRYAFIRTVDEEVFKRRVLVWGAGARASSIGKRLRRRTDQRGFRIAGYVRTPGDHGEAPDGLILSADGDIVRLALRLRVEEIVVAMDDRRAGFPAAELLDCRLRGILVSDLITFLERYGGRVNVELMHPSWLIYSNGFRCDLLRLTSKRLFDVVVSLGLLIVTSPFAVLTALAIYLEDRKPVLYRQLRVGQNGRPFTILKFRSMRVDAESDGRAVWASRNDPRATRVGALIRRLRIDELPQLVNVLKGEMSLVGPRPALPAEVEQYDDWVANRLKIKPGMTGLWQVSGRTETSFSDYIRYDLFYIQNWSLSLDLALLLLPGPQAARREARRSLSASAGYRQASIETVIGSDGSLRNRGSSVRPLKE
jgi:sugar transferase (PEP-CTERM system associated)